MYHKIFTSFSISEHKIKIVRLSGDRKSVKKLATYDVPAGIILQGKVQKEEELSSLIKSIWKKENLHDKTVGIIVPEVSTFMKILTLPDISISEMDEAVRWQAREFLPMKSEDMVLDWKLLSKGPKGAEVLTVATEKSVLFRFVDAVNKAGLFPLIVETPALCLERLAKTKTNGKLVLYRSHGVLVATVISGEKILSSSVFPVGDENALLKSIIQIEARFGRSLIQSISVCGNGLTQDFLNILSQKLSLPIELLKVNVLGISESQVQDYIIPLSQQTIDPEEPASSNSINLLPPIWVKHYKNQIRDIRAWTITLIGSVTLWSCLIVVVATYIFLSQQGSALSSKKQIEVSSDSKAVISEVVSINTNAAKVNKILSSYVYPQTVINMITKQKVQGITIKGYEVNTETNKILIGGTSDTRQNLIKFKDNIEKEGHFIKVNLPILSLLSETNIPFELSFEYKK